MLRFDTRQDGSFTLTLFCPKDKLEELKTRDQAKAFFVEHFSDALEWAGEERLLSDFEKNPRGALVTINVGLDSECSMTACRADVDADVLRRSNRHTTSPPPLPPRSSSSETPRTRWSPFTAKA